MNAAIVIVTSVVLNWNAIIVTIRMIIFVLNVSSMGHGCFVKSVTKLVVVGVNKPVNVVNKYGAGARLMPVTTKLKTN